MLQRFGDCGKHAAAAEGDWRRGDAVLRLTKDGDERMMDGGGWWWMGGGSLVMIVFVALVVLLVVQRPDDARRARAQNPADDILAERFARGEIDENEYRSRSDALSR